MTIDINGEKYECGDSGCWGKYISDNIFFNEYLESIQRKEIIENYIKYSARGIKNLIFFSNPEKLIISGRICKYNYIIKEGVLNYIYSDNIFLRGKEIII